VTPENKMRLYIERECRATNGDKFTTIHGQKGVVTILPDNEMPYLYEDVERKIDFVMSPASVLKRGTPGQVLEATVNLNYFIKCGGLPKDMLSESEITNDLYEPIVRNCFVIAAEDDSNMGAVTCSIGIIRVMQSVLMCYDKIYTNKSLCGPDRLLVRAIIHHSRGSHFAWLRCLHYLFARTLHLLARTLPLFLCLPVCLCWRTPSFPRKMANVQKMFARDLIR